MAVNDIQSGLYKALAEAGRYFSVKLADAVSQNNLPDKISKAISVDSPVVGDNESYVDVKIDTSEGAAPMAAAFEWGSGIHRERGGEKDTYPITPKNKKALAFHWPNHDPPWGSRKFIGLGGDGRFLFTFVDHPGVAPRPYIAPTIVAEKEQIKKILAREFKASILLGVDKITVIE